MKSKCIEVTSIAVPLDTDFETFVTSHIYAHGDPGLAYKIVERLDFDEHKRTLHIPLKPLANEDDIEAYLLQIGKACSYLNQEYGMTIFCHLKDNDRGDTGPEGDIVRVTPPPPRSPVARALHTRLPRLDHPVTEGLMMASLAAAPDYAPQLAERSETVSLPESKSRFS